MNHSTQTWIAAMSTQPARDRRSRISATPQQGLPSGVQLAQTLRGLAGKLRSIAWSPDGQMLACSFDNGSIQLWNVETGTCDHNVEVIGDSSKGTIDTTSIAFAPHGTSLAFGDSEGKVNIRHVHDQVTISSQPLGGVIGPLAFDPSGNILAVAVGRPLNKILFLSLSPKRIIPDRGSHRLDFTFPDAFCVSFDPAGKALVCTGSEGRVIVIDAITRERIHSLTGHDGIVSYAAFDDSGKLLASAGADRAVNLWQASTGRLLRSFEGHTNAVTQLIFLANSELLISNAMDQTIRIWNTANGTCIATMPQICNETWAATLAFHPGRSLLASIGSATTLPTAGRADVVQIFKMDIPTLKTRVAEQSAHYVNAKVVLVGDTGVGKTGLSLVLNDEPFVATESTPGRRVWIFDSRDVRVRHKMSQTRETLLWDLAGQPGYRVIHQLHLNEIAVALVVFDARSETDPLAGVRHWERALRVAQQRQGSSAVPMVKFLVSARNDRGGVSISEERLRGVVHEFNFDGYFKTSAKEGWAIRELQTAICNAIRWSALPEVSSSHLFAYIKTYLLQVKQTGRLLAQAGQLYDEFLRPPIEAASRPVARREEFDTCIGRLENRDLIRRLSFGGYVLLQPELLDAYASAIVNTAKDEPDGLGSLAEDVALAGKFFVPDEHRIDDSSQEEMLLHATVEELVRHDLALRESANDGSYLVFPSQFNRDYEDAPDPRGQSLAITFEGPVQSVYATLAVRLGHSGLFTIGRGEMWRNAAVFTARAGGKCGLFVSEFSDGRGRLITTFDEKASAQTRFHFEEYVLEHTKRRALSESVETVRFFVCQGCGDHVPNNYVKRLRYKGLTEFDCPCGETVSLAEPVERIRFQSKVAAMDDAANWQRDFDAFVLSAKGETNTLGFREWAGGEEVTLAIVFTDIVGSTALGEEIRDTAMNEVRRDHFAQSRKLIRQYYGREIKTIGDSFMTAFRSVDNALDYALSLHADTGHLRVKIRAGIHIGPMHVEDEDVFGGTVNFAARVIGAIQGSEIWLSDRAKEDIDRIGVPSHRQMKWQRHTRVEMKGFSGRFTLWALTKQRQSRVSR